MSDAICDQAASMTKNTVKFCFRKTGNASPPATAPPPQNLQLIHQQSLVNPPNYQHNPPTIPSNNNQVLYQPQNQATPVQLPAYTHSPTPMVTTISHTPLPPAAHPPPAYVQPQVYAQPPAPSLVQPSARPLPRPPRHSWARPLVRHAGRALMGQIFSGLVGSASESATEEE